MAELTEEDIKQVPDEGLREILDAATEEIWACEEHDRLFHCARICSIVYVEMVGGNPYHGRGPTPGLPSFFPFVPRMGVMPAALLTS